MPTETDNPLAVDGILKEVWVHFKAPVELTYGAPGKESVKVPMACLTAAQAREVARLLVVYAEHAEEHAVEWRCFWRGCSTRRHTTLDAAAPTCQRHGERMVRVR